MGGGEESREPMMKPAIFLAIASLLLAASAGADTATIRIDAARPGARLNPKLYGIFLEEINHGVDGGLYAELIQNRGFEGSKAPEGFALRNGRWVNPGGYATTFRYAVDRDLPHWSLVTENGARGTMSLDKRNPQSAANSRSCRLEIEAAGTGRVGIANTGYWGIGVTAGERYALSFWARGGGGFSGPLTATLESADGGTALSDAVSIGGIGAGWKQYRATLTAGKTDPRARFVLAANTPGTVWLDMVSLFPQKTFRNRPNGLRADIAQMIADLKPGFVRFPGGCVVEGATVENAYDWKKTIGPVEQREEIWNVWDYRRTHGMGFHEYLQFCEDLGADPMYVGFSGQTCIYRRGTNVATPIVRRIGEDFLDALDYARGPASSRWGRRRAAAGHPAPFALPLVEIGNENVGPEYEAQYARIYPRLKAAHPDIDYIACFPQRLAPTEMVDEHYYSSPQWFLNNAHFYDRRDRRSPPVYIGEVAVTTNEGGPDRGNLLAALAEGAFLIGVERNADLVRMVSYAPLLGHVEGRTELAGAPPPWHGMIYYDSTRVFGTASYYLWKLFHTNRPSVNVETTVRTGSAQNPGITGGIGVGTWGTSAEFRDVRVEKAGKTVYASDFQTNVTGWTTEGGRWSVEDGALRQAGNVNGFQYFGAEDWSDYTLTLKARKLRGPEGFLIVFGHKGGDRYWWNLGGWGNTQHGLEMNQKLVGRAVPGNIEAGRWYNVRVEVSGRQVRAYLDNKLVHDETAELPERLFAIAGRDEATGELIVKVINPTSEAMTTTLTIAGTGGIAADARATVLTSARPDDTNTLDNPRNVTPITQSITNAGTKFEHAFPPYSLTILRLKAQ